MSFLTIGVEHKTAPLGIRERVALDGDALIRVTADLLDFPAITEVAIVSTCNRTELYLCSADLEVAEDVARTALAREHLEVLPYIQTWRETDAIDHLFRVASGLESQVLGEPQILVQVREAFEIGRRQGTIGTHLHALFRSAISCARQARAGTALGRVTASLGSTAVDVAEATMGALQGRSVLLIGGGEMSKLIAEALRSKQLNTLFIANRTASAAHELAAACGGRPVLLGDIARVLPCVDLVLSATSAPCYVLTAEDIAQPLSRTLHIFDLAIPRDVDPDIALLSGVELHDLDTLLPSGIEEKWQVDIHAIEAIIAAEVHEFMAWHLTRRVVPVITHLRSHVEEVAKLELQRVRPQLKNLNEREQLAVESLTERLIDKMFHHLVVRLRLAAQTDPALVDAAEFFFLHGEGGLFPHALEQPAEKKISS